MSELPKRGLRCLVLKNSELQNNHSVLILFLKDEVLQNLTQKQESLKHIQIIKHSHLSLNSMLNDLSNKWGIKNNRPPSEARGHYINLLLKIQQRTISELNNNNNNKQYHMWYINKNNILRNKTLFNPM